ncbi:MAG TPA: hypothetical protein VHR15_18655, partial [Ktedonobacterales bacterium]|nr:hypothetical protein [Ktedonobacterales bacterium]
MATIPSPQMASPSSRETPTYYDAGLSFDWLMALLSAWLVGGLFLDGWAHTHGRVDQSFFTPWHAVFYSGFVAVAIALLATIVRRRLAAQTWRAAIPSGYGATLAGVTVFAAGGVGDLIWHTLFGIERSIEALLSPTHLMLIIGIILIASGPLRAAWRRPADSLSWGRGLPTLLAMLYILATLTFITQYLYPFDSDWYSRGVALDIASALTFTAILMGGLLLLVGRWRLPFGWVALQLGGIALAMSALTDIHQSVLLALIVGLIADTLYALLRPTRARAGRLRLFAFAVPATLFAGFFFALNLYGLLDWVIHLWTG